MQRVKSMKSIKWLIVFFFWLNQFCIIIKNAVIRTETPVKISYFSCMQMRNSKRTTVSRSCRFSSCWYARHKSVRESAQSQSICCAELYMTPGPATLSRHIRRQICLGAPSSVPSSLPHPLYKCYSTYDTQLMILLPMQCVRSQWLITIAHSDQSVITTVCKNPQLSP